MKTLMNCHDGRAKRDNIKPSDNFADRFREAARVKVMRMGMRPGDLARQLMGSAACPALLS
jgi:hypothetical protein